MPEIIPCDDCEKPCGIHICTGCYEKAKGNLVPGLKKALRILESREMTGKALGCDESYMAAFNDLKIFLDAELWRQEHPQQAAESRTMLD